MGFPHPSDDNATPFRYALGDMNETGCGSGQAGKALEEPIRVLIADDRPRSRGGLRALLDLRPEIVVVGEAADGREAVRLVEELRPDVVLMDARMPITDGLEAARILKERWPAVKVIILTIYPAHRADALTVGADAFLVKGCTTEELLKAILEQCGEV